MDKNFIAPFALERWTIGLHTTASNSRRGKVVGFRDAMAIN
jgi:hypothetical protein